MDKVKKKLTTAQKCARKKTKEENQKKYLCVFVNGKQVTVKRPPMIEGIDADEYIQQNADPIWLHQYGLWEYIRDEGEKQEADTEDRDKR
ncbi:hypothetical protein GO003_012355 [Methylicorpusculum oleiharenae]|uniref:hypothetical protein n=1 Tax=Methylicorpusculum oleiharenae TaxID=1338687 RepID=UPI00135B77A7|nr:hypothetical protein [Methylicorpusculum oleiharenae]MCD2451184.1 hypothetical protein [Methylicorpusculum oleiharenae]